ncbi:MAG: hypothetical protein HC822_22330 [Oscillochloris sp.]|nr:hypothetical protein [Oscillochloris sp.]
MIGAVGDQPIPSVTGVAFSPGANGTITVVVRGSNFVNGATVRWNGQDYTPSAITPTQITVSLPAGAYRSAVVSVVNPSPGGGPSNEFIAGLFRMVIPYLAR